MGKQYFEILDIRDGEVARPYHYESIYWDLRAVDGLYSEGRGESKPLLDRMKELGFSDAEFAKLQEAKTNSDNLVRTETVAMNMVKGLYEGPSGTFTRQAEPDFERAARMMHDDDYHRYKAQIMSPIKDFFQLLDQRTSREYADASATYSQWLLMSAISGAILVLFALAVVFLSARRTTQLVQSVTRVTERIASGRLDDPVRPSGGGYELECLMEKLEAMRQTLSTTVNHILVGAEHVNAASAHIAEGNNDLSRRTEELSRTVEMTARTPQLLENGVAETANNAAQADAQSKQANEVVINAGKVIDGIVVAMHDISESSGEISQITDVINDIAFQTNLLALNAAVEAARAGDQGRGFAVVATEVRNLALRSGEASQRINDLIGRSVQRADQGVQLVGDAGSTIKALITSIDSLTANISEISQATQDQYQGISEVSEALARLNETTEGNASMVEESAAAAEQMSSQARALQEAVSVFSVRETSGSVQHDTVSTRSRSYAPTSLA